MWELGGKNIRIHIFGLNGAIKDVWNYKGWKSVDIEILDYKQCFDSMWLAETVYDLYNGGLTDGDLSILFEANKNHNTVA